jgi:hypothetical protein
MEGMPAELPSQPEQLADARAAASAAAESQLHDEAIEAIVYDVHPALAPRNWAAEYPYGPPQATGDNPFQVRPEDIYRPPPIFKFDFQAAPPAEYMVPQRFGMSAIFGITTALALLFDIMHWLDAEPVWYLFLGAQSIIICLVQMFHGKTPRQASSVAGAIIAPLFVLGWGWLTRDTPAGGVVCLMVISVPLGAFLGYLNGTCAAGIFLVMDKFEKYMQGERPVIDVSTAPPAGAS